MGGASAAVADSSSSQHTNPAATVNLSDEAGWHWDYHLDFDVAPSKDLQIEYNDQFDSPGYSINRLNLGFAVQKNNWGGGLSALNTSYKGCLAGSTCANEVEFKNVNVQINLATKYWSQELIFALSADFNTLEINQSGSKLLEFSNGAFSLSTLYQPTNENYAFAFVFRPRIRLKLNENDTTLTLPERVYRPASFDLGYKYKFDSTKYWLLAADLKIVGNTPSGNSLEAWIRDEELATGRFWSISPRIGVEHLLLPKRMKIRAGTYLEPARFSGVSPRMHATLGTDVRLFEVWGYHPQLTAAFDFAKKYQLVSISIFSLWR